MSRTLSALSLAACLLFTACSHSDNSSNAAESPASDSPPLPVALAGGTRPFSEEVLYFMLPDRFANGDTENDCGFYTEECSDTADLETLFQHGYLPTDKGFYHGGDIAGLISRLDYLADLGITAIWVGPIFKNKPVQDDVSNLYEKSSGYHGYWITDFMNVDPHFGSNAEFAALVTEAHQRDIKVFMDIITNHTADVIKYTDDDYSYLSKTDVPYRDAAGVEFDDQDFAYNGSGSGSDTFPALNLASFPHEPFVPDAEQGMKNPAWLNDPLLYHNRGDTSFTGENSVYGDFFGLDDLFTERKAVVDGMIDIYRHWIDEYGVDGFRIDTTKHVNIEFWQAFGPAIEAAAQDAGIDHFFAFGEVYDEQYSPAFRSVFSTRASLQSTIDFGFQAAARDFASRSLPTSALAEFYALDDLYTDADSNAYSQPVFLGNHDMGRFGFFLQQDQPEATDDEWLARSRLGHALMFFGRGQPVIYYGDEQGFTGDGGDKDARENMFVSRVDVYNDNVLIGSPATTADDNFDPTHPLYETLSELSAVYREHDALRSGVQIQRYASDDAGLFAFSRLSHDNAVEYVVALNNSNETRSAEVPTWSERSGFEQLYGDGEPTIGASDNGTLLLSLPPFGVTVLRADEALNWTNSAPPQVSLAFTASTESDLPNQHVLYTGSKDGYDTVERLKVAAQIDTDQLHQVAFEFRAGDGEYESMGTDGGKPYAVYFDPLELEDDEPVTFRATVTTPDGLTTVAESEPQTLQVSAPELAGPRYNHAIIHYQRKDNDYGDDANCWGVHVWGEAVAEETDWAAPLCMTGEDRFGRFAVVELASTTSPVNLIVHTPEGDTVGINREPGGDRSFDAAVTPEIWLRQDDETLYLSNPELSVDTSRLRLHYRRPAGDYEGWGLHVWGDTTATVAWEAPLMPSASDDFGRVFDVPLADDAEVLNYVFHKGDEKDPGPDQSIDFTASAHELWQVQGADPAAPHILPVDDASMATIHYHRPAGDYDGWGLHLWGDVAEDTLNTVTWETPLLPARSDAYGLVFEIPLTSAAESIGYIVHKGDEKDPDGDLGLEFAIDGYEVWQQQGASVSAPHVLPLKANF